MMIPTPPSTRRRLLTSAGCRVGCDLWYRSLWRQRHQLLSARPRHRKSWPAPTPIAVLTTTWRHQITGERSKFTIAIRPFKSQHNAEKKNELESAQIHCPYIWMRALKKLNHVYILSAVNVITFCFTLYTCERTLQLMCFCLFSFLALYPFNGWRVADND